MGVALQLWSISLGSLAGDLGLTFFPRLLLAIILGAVLGLERRRRQKVAGLRTHMVICLAACLIAAVGVGASVGYPHSDPTRVGAQILSGIGFIGAGVILRQGLTTVGVTTSANILLVTGIGLACGFGQYSLAIIATVLDVLALHLTAKYLPNQDKQTDTSDSANAPIKFSCHPERFEQIRTLLGTDYKLLSISRRGELLKVTVGTSLSAEQREKLLDRMIATPEIISMETSEPDDQVDGSEL